MTTENTIAKLRILLNRAQRAETAAAKIKNAEMNAAHAKYFPFSEALHRASSRLHFALEAIGICGYCEKPNSECEGHGPAMAAHSSPIEDFIRYRGEDEFKIVLPLFPDAGGDAR